MRYIAICSLLFSVNIVFAQTWNLIWSDEFNGNDLDSNYWSHEIGTGSQNGLFGWGNGELQYYQPQNSVVSNGTLKIIAQHEPNGLVDSWNNTYYYSSSRIVTRNKKPRTITTDRTITSHFKKIKGTSCFELFLISAIYHV